jgi:hypothetical protein
MQANVFRADGPSGAAPPRPLHDPRATRCRGSGQRARSPGAPRSRAGYSQVNGSGKRGAPPRSPRRRVATLDRPWHGAVVERARRVRVGDSREDMAFCFRHGGRAAADASAAEGDAAPPQARPTVLQLYLEARECTSRSPRRRDPGRIAVIRALREEAAGPLRRDFRANANHLTRANDLRPARAIGAGGRRIPPMMADDGCVERGGHAMRRPRLADRRTRARAIGGRLAVFWVLGFAPRRVRHCAAPRERRGARPGPRPGRRWTAIKRQRPTLGDLEGPLLTVRH